MSGLPFDIRLFERLERNERFVAHPRIAVELLLARDVPNVKPLYTADGGFEREILFSLASWLSPLEIANNVPILQWELVRSFVMQDETGSAANVKWERAEQAWRIHSDMVWQAIYNEYAYRRANGQRDQMSNVLVAKTIRRQYQLALRSQSLFQVTTMGKSGDYRLRLLRQDFFPSHAHFTLAIYLRQSQPADGPLVTNVVEVDAPGKRNRALMRLMEGRVRVLTRIVSGKSEWREVSAINHDRERFELTRDDFRSGEELRPFDIQLDIVPPDDDDNDEKLFRVANVRGGMQISNALIQSESFGALKIYLINDVVYNDGETAEHNRRAHVYGHVRDNIKRQLFVGYVPESVSLNETKLAKVGPSVLEINASDNNDAYGYDQVAPNYGVDASRVMGARLVFDADVQQGIVWLDTSQPVDSTNLRHRTWLMQQTPRAFGTLFFLYGPCPVVLYRRSAADSLPENTDMGAVGATSAMMRHAEAVWPDDDGNDDDADATYHFIADKYRDAQLINYAVNAHSQFSLNTGVLKPEPTLLSGYPSQVRVAFGEAATPTLIGFYMPQVQSVDLESRRDKNDTVLVIQDPDKNLFCNRVELFRTVVFLQWKKRTASSSFRQQEPLSFVYQLHYGTDGSIEAILLAPNDYAKNSNNFPFETFWTTTDWEQRLDAEALAGEEPIPVLSLL